MERNQKTIPFIIVPEKIKYLGINLTKDLKDTYSKKYKTLKKEIEDYTKRWKESPMFMEQ
jgi:hypothetical protein